MLGYFLPGDWGEARTYNWEDVAGGDNGGTIIERTGGGRFVLDDEIDVTLNSTDNTVVLSNHPFRWHHRVVFSGGTLPGELSMGTTYYVVNPTGNNYQLSTTKGGDPIEFTTNGSDLKIYDHIDLRVFGVMTTNPDITGNFANAVDYAKGLTDTGRKNLRLGSGRVRADMTPPGGNVLGRVDTDWNHIHIYGQGWQLEHFETDRGDNNDIVFIKKPTVAGTHTVRYNNPGTVNAELSWTLNNNELVFSLATDSTGAITTTANDILYECRKAIHDDNLNPIPKHFFTKLKDGQDGSGVVQSMTTRTLTMPSQWSELAIKGDVVSNNDNDGTIMWIGSSTDPGNIEDVEIYGFRISGTDNENPGRGETNMIRGIVPRKDNRDHQFSIHDMWYADCWRGGTNVAYLNQVFKDNILWRCGGERAKTAGESASWSHPIELGNVELTGVNYSDEMTLENVHILDGGHHKYPDRPQGGGFGIDISGAVTATLQKYVYYENNARMMKHATGASSNYHNKFKEVYCEAGDYTHGVQITTIPTDIIHADATQELDNVIIDVKGLASAATFFGNVITKNKVILINSTAPVQMYSLGGNPNAIDAEEIIVKDIPNNVGFRIRSGAGDVKIHKLTVARCSTHNTDSDSSGFRCSRDSEVGIGIFHHNGTAGSLRNTNVMIDNGKRLFCHNIDFINPEGVIDLAAIQNATVDPNEGIFEHGVVTRNGLSQPDPENDLSVYRITFNPRVSYSKTMLRYGRRSVATTEDIVIKNSKGESVIGDILISGAGFTIQSPSPPTGRQINAGETETVTVKFEAETPGDYEGTLKYEIQE